MEDRAIVQALRDRDRDGLAAAYDRYAQRLYDYCAGLLHDSHTAADAVHDTLLVAADRAAQLRDPGAFRPWLYAIARNECLRQLRQRNRIAPLEKAGDVKDETIDLGRSVQAEQARVLVQDAAAGLNPREQEVLNLTLRHELSGPELAAALGVTPNHAHALTSKAREQLERSVGALLTARTGRADCGELDTMLSGWDGAFTPLLRKRVSRHLEKCAVCGARKKHEVRAEALFAAIPFALLPIALRRRVLDSSADLNRVAHHGRIAAPYDGAGFPIPLDRSSRRSKAAAWLAGAAVITLLIGSGAMYSLRPGSQEATLAEPPAPVVPTSGSPFVSESPLASPTSASPSASPTPSRSVSPTPSRRAVPTPPRTRRPVPPTRPSPSRSTSPSTSPSRSTSPSPRPSPPVINGADFVVSCGTGDASATVGGGTPSRVLLTYWPARDAQAVRRAAMSFNGKQWVATVEDNFGLSPWQFTVTATGPGGTGSADGNARNICIG